MRASAALAAHRFALNALRFKEFLFTGGKNKIFTAVPAFYDFILKHLHSLAFILSYYTKQKLKVQ
jgi:hypothetical protein